MQNETLVSDDREISLANRNADNWTLYSMNIIMNVQSFHNLVYSLGGIYNPVEIQNSISFENGTKCQMLLLTWPMRFEYPINEAPFTVGPRVHLADGPNSECKDPLTRIFAPRNV
jgi:hypothetical protein